MTRGLFSVAGVATGFGTMNDEPDIIIGERHGWGDPQPFGISQVDQRQHVYVIGKTGSGKTTLLHNLILQHIALGHGVGLIDPHGDLAEELLHHICDQEKRLKWLNSTPNGLCAKDLQRLKWQSGEKRLKRFKNAVRNST